MLAIRTILHPTDFSECSALAFRLACSLAHDYAAQLIVLHVAEAPITVASEGLLVVPPPLHLEPLREKLHRLRPRNPNFPVEHRLVRGDTASEILRVADETHCDVIVLGTHGDKWLAPRIMGSVAEQVARRACCPVLLVKAPVRSRRPAEATGGGGARGLPGTMGPGSEAHS
jgi:nucleotide-binding universal stress UspA family protein